MIQLSRLHPVVPNHAPFLDHISEVLPHMKLVEYELGVCRKESLERYAKLQKTDGVHLFVYSSRL